MLAAMTGNRTWGDFGIDAEEMRRALEAVPTASDAAAAVRAFFDAYAERQGKPRWGDKTPAYMLSVQRIGRTLPEARFIHLIRDGRDVALSQSARALNEQPPPAEQAARWVKRIRKSREQAQALKGARYVEARYEDLVRDPEPTLRRICEFIDLAWDDGVLSYHERAAERLERDGRRAARRGTARDPAGRLPDRQPRADDEAAGPVEARQVAARDAARRTWRAYEGVAGEMLGRARLRGERLMRVGIVTKWFNRGQAFVSRYVRDALDARGPRDLHPRPADQGQGRDGRAHRPQRRLGPARRHRGLGVGGALRRVRELDRRQRARGRPLGQLLPARGDRAAARVRRADRRPLRLGDVLARGRRAGEARLRRPLLDDPLRAARATRRWGSRAPTSSGACTASCSTPRRGAAAAPRDRDDLVRFYFPGALLGPRKPHKEVVEAFRAAKGDNLRLIFKAQLERRMNYLERAAEEDPRIELVDRRHADRRAPAAVRRLRRLPRPEPLGGPRPVPLRGGRLRDAADHQRQPADERGRPRRRQRAARPRRPGRRRALGDPLDEAGRAGADRGDRAARRSRPSASAWPRAPREPRGAELGAHGRATTTS